MRVSSSVVVEQAQLDAARRARRTARSSCPPRPRSAPSGNGRPGQTSVIATSAPASGASRTRPSLELAALDASPARTLDPSAHGTRRRRDRRSCRRSSNGAAAHAQPRAASSSNAIASASPGGSSAAQRQQLAGRAPRSAGSRSPGELRALERRRVLRVGHLLAELGERGELAPAPLARGAGDLLVDVVGEELERRLLAVLLAHEQHRRERREQRAERGQRPGRSAAAGRRRRGCRPGRGSGRRRRTRSGGTSSAGAPKRRWRKLE